MTAPTTPVNTTNVDSEGDKLHNFRADALDLIQKFNQLITTYNETSSVVVTGSDGKINNTLLAANLGYLSGLTAAADKLPYFSSSGAMSTATFTGIARTILEATTQLAARQAMGLGEASTMESGDGLGDLVPRGHLGGAAFLDVYDIPVSINQSTISDGDTIDDSMRGKIIVANPVSNSDIYLPTHADMENPDGFSVLVINRGYFNLTVNRTSTETINGDTSLEISGVYKWAHFYRYGSTGWLATTGG